MSGIIKTSSEESFFVYVKDTNTEKIKRIAFPSDVQVGLSGNPKELQLLGALSLSTKDFLVSEKSFIFNLTEHDTIANLKYKYTPPSAQVTVYLPSNPRDGQLHCIKDADGIASDIEITIKSALSNVAIDNSMQYIMGNSYESIILYWKNNKWQILMKSVASGGGGGAPTNANYLTLSSNSTLTNERTLSVSGSNLTLVDNGANSTAQLDLSSILGGGAGTYTYATVTADAFGRITAISSGTPPPGSAATYVTLSNDASLSNERRLTTSGSNLTLVDNGPNNTVQLDLTSILGAGAGTFTNASVTADSFGRITAISSGPATAPLTSSYIVVSNDSTLSHERALAVGLGLILTDAGANSSITIAINNNILATISGSTFTGPVIAQGGLSGSLQNLATGISYLVAGQNITISSQSNGQVIISSTASGSSGGSGADPGASYIVVNGTASLPNERVLTAGYGIGILDGGSNGNIIVSFQGSLSSSGEPSVYFGYTTASINLNSTSSWAPFLSGTEGHFVDIHTSSIIRTLSTFTIDNSGLYKFHASFNTYGNDAYITLRLSGSSGVVLKRSTYRTSPLDQNPAILDGIFKANSSSSWTLQYITSGTVYPWVVSNPIIDDGNMWTGEISICKV